MKNTTRPIIAAAIALVAMGSNASAASYLQNFNVVDGLTDLGDGSQMNGTANIKGGALELTADGGASGFSSFMVPALPGSSAGWVATFDLIIEDSAGANEPADGLSFNYGNFTLGELGSAEEGMSNQGGVTENISFEIDTWMNTDTEQGVNISEKVGGVVLTDVAFTNGSILADGTMVSTRVVMSWHPVDGASFETNGLLTDADFSNVATTFVGSDTHLFGISGRVGGANQTTLIDNLTIHTVVPEPTGTALLGLASLGFFLRRRR